MAKSFLFGMCLCAFAFVHTPAAEPSASTESPSTNLLVASPTRKPLTTEEAKQALQRIRVVGQPFQHPGIFPPHTITIQVTWRHFVTYHDQARNCSSTSE